MRVTMKDQAGLLAQAAIWHGQEAMRDDSIALGIINSAGVLQAVVTIDNRTATSCDMHISSNHGRRWATKSVLQTIYSYAFNILGVTKLKTTTPAANVPIMVACLHMGWRIEGVTKCGAHDGTDGVYFGMTRDECPWLAEDENNGK